MKTSDKKVLTVRTVTVALLLFASFYMYDFYKCLSGFIANGFREPLVMLPMILAFFLPVLCFLLFFFDNYAKGIAPSVKIAWSVFVFMYAVINFIMILGNIGLYISNNALGVYDALPSIILHFPYDMIILLPVLAVLQIFNVAVIIASESPIGKFKNGLGQRGCVKIGVTEYIAVCLLGIFALIFTGAAICAAFTSIENAFYDVRFIYLLLWVMLIPLGNIVFMVIKPEKMNISLRAKRIIPILWIMFNLLFALLFLFFELASPDFLIHIGKPLFLIAFSVSMPIEPAIIFIIMAVGTVKGILSLRRSYGAS